MGEKEANAEWKDLAAVEAGVGGQVVVPGEDGIGQDGVGGKLPPHDHRILEEDDAEPLQQAQEALSREVLAVSLTLAVVPAACLRVRVEPRQPLVDPGPDGLFERSRGQHLRSGR